MSTLIKGGLVVSSQESHIADVLLDGEHIAAVGTDIAADGCDVVDATGCLVMPGFIDADVKFYSAVPPAPADDFYSGSRAALAGGTTTVIATAVQQCEQALAAALETSRRSAEGHSCCDYAFHAQISDWNEQTRLELPELLASGVSSFTVSLAEDGLSDTQLYRLLCEASRLGIFVSAHCENGELVKLLGSDLRAAHKLSVDNWPLSRPSWCETESIDRFISIAQLAGGVPVNVLRVSCEKSLRVIRRARREGLKIYSQSCTPYFLLNDSLYSQGGFAAAKYVCVPPLRRSSDQKALYDAVNNSELDTVDSGHAGYNFGTQKIFGVNDFAKIPTGIPGVEDRAGLIYSSALLEGIITENQFVRLMSENAAKLYGLYPRKGAIAVGSDADVVVWDRYCERTLAAERQNLKVDYNAYEGQKLQGQAKAVFLRGELAAQYGVLMADTVGQYLPREKSKFYR